MRCEQSRQLPRLHRRPGRAEAASPDTPAASAFSTPPLRRLWLPISVTDLINGVHGERLAGIEPAIFGVAPCLLPRRFSQASVSCLDLDQIVCVSIEPFGPCPTLTVRLPSPGELPPHRPGPASRQGLFLAAASAQQICRRIEPFAPCPTLIVPSRVSRRNFSTYQFGAGAGG